MPNSASFDSTSVSSVWEIHEAIETFRKNSWKNDQTSEWEMYRSCAFDLDPVVQYNEPLIPKKDTLPQDLKPPSLNQMTKESKLEDKCTNNIHTKTNSTKKNQSTEFRKRNPTNISRRGLQDPLCFYSECHFGLHLPCCLNFNSIMGLCTQNSSDETRPSVQSLWMADPSIIMDHIVAEHMPNIWHLNVRNSKFMQLTWLVEFLDDRTLHIVGQYFVTQNNTW